VTVATVILIVPVQLATVPAKLRFAAGVSESVTVVVIVTSPAVAATQPGSCTHATLVMTGAAVCAGGSVLLLLPGPVLVSLPPPQPYAARPATNEIKTAARDPIFLRTRDIVGVMVFTS
jgi:hypothetical protein